MIDSFNIIETNILHSDGHALIKFALKYTFQHETNMEQTFNTQRNPPWNESQTDDFICNIDVNQIQSLINDISSYSNEQPNASSNIDIFSERLSHILIDSAQKNLTLHVGHILKQIVETISHGTDTNAKRQTNITKNIKKYRKYPLWNLCMIISKK